MIEFQLPFHTETKTFSVHLIKKEFRVDDNNNNTKPPDQVIRELMTENEYLRKELETLKNYFMPVVPKKPIYIKCPANGKCVDVRQASKSQADIILWSFHGKSNQQFHAIEASGEYFLIYVS